MQIGQCFKLLFIGLLLMSGCASSPPVEPRSVPLQIVATANINPHSDGAAQPVDVLVFQLQGSRKFDGVTLTDIYPQADKPQAALGDEFVRQHKYRISPGTDLNMQLDVEPQTRFIGVVVAFEQYHRAVWRTVLQIRDDSALDKVLFRGKKIEVRLDDVQVAALLGS